MTDRRSLKRQQAEERQVAYAALTPKAKLAKLDDVLGPGQGAAKERKRLAALIEAQAVQAPPAKDKAKS